MKNILLILLFVFQFFQGFCQSDLFYAVTENRQLLKLDISNCSSTLIGYTDSIMTDIALTPTNKLYGTDGKYLYQIDTGTCAQTLISNLSTYITFSNSLVSDENGNLLTVDAGALYRMNPVNGIPVWLGHFGNYTSAGDLAFYNDTLYLSAIGNNLVKIIQGPTLSSQLVGTMSSNNIFGVNTVCYNNSEIIVASGATASVLASIFIVDPQNAMLTPLCSTIANNVIYGAASSHDFENSGSCNFTFISNSDSRKHELIIFPNPATTSVLIRTEVPYDFFELSDLSGKQIMKGLIHSLQFSVDLKAVPNGMYYLTVGNKSGILHRKIVKE